MNQYLLRFSEIIYLFFHILHNGFLSIVIHLDNNLCQNNSYYHARSIIIIIVMLHSAILKPIKKNFASSIMSLSCPITVDQIKSNMKKSQSILKNLPQYHIFHQRLFLCLSLLLDGISCKLYITLFSDIDILTDLILHQGIKGMFSKYAVHIPFNK